MPAVAEAYYCEECVQLGKDRDGCPCILNVGKNAVDGYYERKKNVME
jgi:PHD finger-like domain-containing protein 5A